MTQADVDVIVEAGRVKDGKVVQKVIVLKRSRLEQILAAATSSGDFQDRLLALADVPKG